MSEKTWPMATHRLDERRGEREDVVVLEGRVERRREAEAALDLADDGLVAGLDGEDGASGR